MKLIKKENLKAKILPNHEKVYSREIWGLTKGAENCVVMYNEMKADGGAEMHIHKKAEHVFYVLEGKMTVTNGDETYIVNKGESLAVPAGELHEARGKDENCKYLLFTSPPVTYPVND